MKHRLEREELNRERKFPIYHKGKKYEKKDCGEIFLSFYTTPLALRYDNAVYVGDKVWVLPDDTFKHE